MTNSWSLALCFCLGVNSQDGEQNLQVLSIQEGKNATVNCSYKTTITNLQWYRQDPSKGLTQLVMMYSNEKHKDKGRLQFKLDTSAKTSSLFITASQAADATTYFCAVDAQCSTGSCSPNINTARAATYKFQQWAELCS